MSERSTPYGAFNFLVEFSDNSVSGGFSEVSGLGTELEVSEYREGSDKEKYVQKVPGLNKTGDITLKRGLMDRESLWSWIENVRLNGRTGYQNVVVKLMDETGAKEVQKWVLTNALPLKWGGPSLAAKSSGEIAMEELTISAEYIELK